MKIGVSRSRSRTSCEHLHAGVVGHHQVEQDQVVGVALQLVEAFGAVLRQVDRVALRRSAAVPGFRGCRASSSMTSTLPLLVAAQRRAASSFQAAFTGFLAGAGRGEGSSRRNVAPPLRRLETSMEPPCS